MTYAILLDLDVDSLKQSYPTPAWENAYGDIKDFLGKQGFIKQTGNLYIGGASINAVSCVLAIQKLSAEFPWFFISVRQPNMLRINEITNLTMAISD